MNANDDKRIAEMPTPRTNALMRWRYASEDVSALFDLCRQLERELAMLHSCNDENIRSYSQAMEKLKSEITALESQLAQRPVVANSATTAEMPTPRTNEVVQSIGKSGVDWHHSASLMRKHAEQLEREITALEAKLAEADGRKYGIICKSCSRDIHFSHGDWLHSDGNNYNHAAHPSADNIPGGPTVGQAWQDVCDFWDKVAELRKEVADLKVWKEASDIELSKAHSELAKWQSGLKPKMNTGGGVI